MGVGSEYQLGCAWIVLGRTVTGMKLYYCSMQLFELDEAGHFPNLRKGFRSALS